jgi:prevent-host-death family protein
MPTVNLHAAKTHLSRLVDKAMAGEEVVIAKAGKPMVRLVPIETKSRRTGFGTLKARSGSATTSTRRCQTRCSAASVSHDEPPARARLSMSRWVRALRRRFSASRRSRKIRHRVGERRHKSVA